MFSIFFISCRSAIVYDLAGTILTISGEGGGNITQKGVMSVGNPSFYQRVIINEGPTVIERNTFEGCNKLEYISIPASIELIEPCFTACFSLTEISVHADNPNYCNDKFNNLLSKDEKTLVRAPAIKDPTIPEGIERIGDSAFRNNLHVVCNDVVFPSTVKYLDKDCFISFKAVSISFAPGVALETFSEFKYSSTDKLVIPKSVISIPEGACYSSTIALLEFEANSALQTLVLNAFSNTRINKPVVLPDSILTIEENAFKESTLKEIQIGENCTSVHIYAFSGCSYLRSVTISDKNKNFVKEEGILMNQGKTEIIFIDINATSVAIAPTIQSFGKTVFQSLKNLTEVTAPESTYFSTLDGAVYNHDYSTLYAICGGATDVTAHENLKTISIYAAKQITTLNSFTLKATDKLLTISQEAFASTNISTFTVPHTVTSIEWGAFTNCINLKTIDIPENSQLEVFAAEALSDTIIEKLFIPQKVKTIGYSLANGCKSLKNVTFHPQSEVTHIQQWSFSVSGITSIVLPAKLIELRYETFTACKSLKSVKFEEGSQLAEIQSSTFYYCLALEEVELPDTVKTIRKEAFYMCGELKIFKHQASIIESGAFLNCKSLPNFNFSSTQEVPNPSIFQGCNSLMKFTVDKGNEKIKDSFGAVFNKGETILILFPPGEEAALIAPSTIAFGNNAFAWSINLKHVAFHSGSSLATIGEYTFLECTALRYFQFPSRLTCIQKHCFDGCISLKKITLPESINSIEQNAFANCHKLSYVKYCGTNEVTGSCGFSNKVVVGVTEYYNYTTFSSIPVKKELTVDCELIFIQVSCKYHNIPFSKVFVLASLYFVID